MKSACMLALHNSCEPRAEPLLRIDRRGVREALLQETFSIHVSIRNELYEERLELFRPARSVSSINHIAMD